MLAVPGVSAQVRHALLSQHFLDDDLLERREDDDREGRGVLEGVGKRSTILVVGRGPFDQALAESDDVRNPSRR